MKKHFTKLVLLIFTVAFVGQYSTAQTVIWGGPGDKNGEFDGGLNDWTVNAVSPNDSAVWIWNAEGKADRGSFYAAAGDPAIKSPSVSNGAAVFDSDYYDNGGDYSVDQQIGDGIAPAPQNSELISPAFSCEGHDDVWVSFYQYYRNYQSTPKLVVSKDGGENWEAPIEVNPDIVLKGVANGEKLINISAYAANQSNVKIKFVWEGDYYFWIIDDVSVITAPPSDPQIVGTWFPPNVFYTPLMFINKDDMNFVMEVQNYGGKESSDVLGKVRLIHIPSSTTYFADSTTFGVAPGDTVVVEFNSFVPTTDMDTGYYAAVYSIDVEDAATDSWKEYIQYFKISGNEYVDFEDNHKVFINAYTTNDGNPSTFIKIGDTKEEYNINIYRTGDWVKNDSIKVLASDVTMSLAIAEQDNDMTFNVDANLILLDDTVKYDLSNFNFEGLGVDGTDNPQLSPVGYSSESITAPEYSEFSSPFFDGDDNEGIELEPNSVYFLTARWGTEQTYYQGFDNRFGKYNRYYFGIQSPYLLYTADGYSGGFTDTEGAWDMGMLLKIFISPGTGVDDNLLPANTVTIKENPVKDKLYVDIDFNGNVVDKATMVVHDINGQIIDMRTVENLNKGSFSFYTNNLPNGTYIFTLFTKDKLISKKFVVVK